MSALSVLYVDDDPDIREVAELSLGLDGEIQTRTAESGASALAILDDGLVPDAILLDVMMPGLDGQATLGQIRQRPHLAKVPVIFITARAMGHEQALLLAQGAKAIIVKPFDPISLARKVRDVLAAP